MIVAPEATPTQRRPLPRSYLAWLGGSLTSQIGSAAMLFALTWAATEHGGRIAGLVLAAVVAPRVLFLLVGGVVGDRAGARAVMLTCDAAMVGVAVTVAVLADAIGTPVALLLIAGVLTGVNDAFYLPSSGSMSRRMVEPEQVGRAVALRSGGKQLVTTFGAPVGGGLVAFGGLATAAWVDAGTFLVSLVVLALIRPRFTPPEPAATGQFLRDTVDGVRVTFRVPGLGMVLLLVAGAAGVVMPVNSLLVPLLARQNDWGAGAAGIVVGAFGFGTMVVMLLVARAGTHGRPGVLACGGCLVVAFGMAVVGLAPSLPAAVIAAFVAGIGGGVFLSHLTPMLLKAAPESHLARVQAMFSLAQSVAVLVMHTALGSTAQEIGASMTVVLCALVLTFGALTAFASRQIRHLR